jgi:spermidine synthase
MVPSFALPAAFFLSGSAGLIFQIVWLYRCGLVLGSSVAAVTVVLSGFMAGLGLGNALAATFADRVRRPLLVYATLEVIVAVAGVAMTAVLPHVGFLLAPVARVADGGSAMNLLRFGIAFACLVVPATAMGATLPILVGALCQSGDRFGSALGRLYGWNTLGALAGVIACEVVLIAAVGISGSAWIAAGLNVCAAAVAWTVQGKPDATRSANVRQKPDVTDSSEPVWPLLSATALSGALLLALEVIWFRFLSMYVLITTLAMSLMLAVVLAGIGAGGLIAAGWLRRYEPPEGLLPVLASVSGLAVVGSYVLFQAITSGTQAAEWQQVLWFTCVLSLPTSLLSGALFTLIGHALHRTTGGTTSAAGWLTLANTAGALSGPPIAAYLLLPNAGMERTFFVVAMLYGLVSLLAGLGTRTPSPSTSRPWTAGGRSAAIVATAVLLLVLGAFPFGTMNGRYFLRAASAYSDDGSTIVATSEGPSETVFVMQQQWLGKPVYSRLVTNGFSMSGTALQGQRYMRAFAYYPALMHDGPLKRALVVCYGVGVTAGAVTHLPEVETIDVAEISKDVVAMSGSIYPAGTSPLADPRIRLHIEDGRFFLQTTADRFDLITGEPPPPRTPGAVNIYTREYFQLVHDRLNDGGLATYWVPVARPHPGTDVNTIVRAFCDVFRDCSLWNATPFDLMLIGSRGLRGPRTLEQFNAPWQTPGLEARLREVGFERPEQIGATFIGDAEYLRALTAGTPPLTDDYPQRLRPASGRPSLSDPGYGADAAVTRMYQSTLDVSRARAAFSASPFIRSLWPAPLIDRTLPYFEQQAIINRVYWEGGRPLQQIDDLDRVLAQTTLRTLPLWILGSDEVKQRIAEGAAEPGGVTDYSRALRAISGRDFAGAVQLLAAADRRGFRAQTLGPLLAYSSFKGGQPDLTRKLSAAAQPVDDGERHFWEWLRAAEARSPLPRSD